MKLVEMLDKKYMKLKTLITTGSAGDCIEMEYNGCENAINVFIPNLDGFMEVEELDDMINNLVEFREILNSEIKQNAKMSKVQKAQKN